MKIAFFDIDGTLIEFGTPGVSEKVVQALNTLHENGVKLFLATGRPPYLLPKFENIPFDGALCFNGSYCFNNDEVIYSSPLSHDDIDQIIENAKAINEPIMIAAEKRKGANFFSPVIEEYMYISYNHCNVVEDYDVLRKENIFQLMAATKPSQDEYILKNTKHATITRWWDQACDIIPDTCSKAAGIEKILDYYGFEKSDAIAFGDGGNDLEMLEYVGLGIAMGNAKDYVKEKADYITDTCLEDGVYTALKHFQLI